jgi:hypothetical protein
MITRLLVGLLILSTWCGSGLADAEKKTRLLNDVRVEIVINYQNGGQTICRL